LKKGQKGKRWTLLSTNFGRGKGIGLFSIKIPAGFAAEGGPWQKRLENQPGTTRRGAKRGHNRSAGWVYDLPPLEQHLGGGRGIDQKGLVKRRKHANSG